jgi:DNA-binding NtrC family response regulator
MFKIYVVEDEKVYAATLQHHLSLNPEYEVETFSSGEELLRNIYKKPDAITLDYTLPDYKGDVLLKKVKTLYPEIPVIIVSGQDNISTAVELLKEGAYDYIVKNEETNTRLWITIKNLRETVKLKNEVVQLREEVKKKYDFSQILKGNSLTMIKVFSFMQKACETNITVSISGETGTGKELVAKAIHFNSNRRSKPLVAVNMSAIPKDLIESELFGYEKGAFTGANNRKLGRFEEATQGTIFLDEIAEIDISLQAKLLRVLQEKEVTRLGSNLPVKLDVRILVATHKNLLEEVKQGRFREDLYYRLLGLPITLPPLRERGNDILLLSKFFLDEFCKENGFQSMSFTLKAKEKLLKYPYPGNVRELKAVVELCAVMSDKPEIEAEDISFNPIHKSGDILLEEDTLENYDRKIIFHYLEKYNRNVLLVARKLQVGKSTIYRMLQEERGE